MRFLLRFRQQGRRRSAHRSGGCSRQANDEPAGPLASNAPRCQHRRAMAGGISRIKVLVVDDHRAFAEAVAIALGTERDLSAVVAGGGAEAIGLGGSTPTGRVLMGLEKPGVRR